MSVVCSDYTNKFILNCFVTLTPQPQGYRLLWTPEIFLASILTRKTSGPERQHPL